MGRKPSPWFWSQIQEWCVTLGKQRRRLGKNPPGAPTPRKSRGKWVVPAEIDQAFHDLMANQVQAPPSSIESIVERFLDWTHKNRSPATYEWYRIRLQSFMDSLQPRLLAVSGLKPHHVEDWVGAHSDWSPNYVRGCLTAVSRSLNWAAKKGHIPANPIHKRLEKPSSTSKKTIVTDETYAKMLEVAPPHFRILLEIAWETGARPQELIRVEARHVELENTRWVFSKDESKGKKKERVVYLPPRALEITQAAVEKNPTGCLFRRKDGHPWRRNDVKDHFSRLTKKVGVHHRLYDFRHTYITRGMKNGVDPVTMANLVGHKDLKMIHEIYNHACQDTDFMRQAATRAVSGASEQPVSPVPAAG
jgi:integrase